MIAFGGVFLFLLAVLLVSQVVSIKKRNGVEVESPVYYLLTTMLLTLLPLMSNPLGTGPEIFYILIGMILTVTAWQYYRLPKITIIEVDWLFTVQTVRKVLSQLGYDFEEKVTTKQMSESQVYQFLIDGGKARINVSWPMMEHEERSSEDNSQKDIVIRFSNRCQFPHAKDVHTELIEAFRVRREGKIFTNNLLFRKMVNGIIFLIPLLMYLYILFI
ncbi:hypothetical protein [Halalkalibacter okhensis]|uniref:Uncharacterized protein n=1 Tax=Halalkalibacter okhensis TaxID=333138 RepID=A0A0B0IFJ4_9BACI|nr:hypothetical protein [Halalkalibacter okhensis]KHF41338.1 hypothetical protein LQ50_03630 [Halalkalibacter okhensis]